MSETIWRDISIGMVRRVWFMVSLQTARGDQQEMQRRYRRLDGVISASAWLEGSGSWSVSKPHAGINRKCNADIGDDMA
ncbi:hypothetical protein D3C73_1464280 [compost metagenome]